MNLFRKSKFPRLIIGLAVLWIAASVAVPHTAHADGMLSGALHWTLNKIVGTGSVLTDIQLSVVGWIIYGINYVVSIIVGLFISVVVYGIAIILQLNGNVMNTLAVQTGFQVTLAVANLGFVLGIIIIAIATILHRQTYGVKSLLWKLVFAAILVNFSLIIGGVIINAANSLTTTFLVPFSNAGFGGSGFDGFANALAGAFSPHRPWLSGIVQSAQNAAQNTNASTLAGSAVASQILPIFSVVFTVAMLIVIFITLCVFFFMLIIRYLYLTFLLILMPLAWLLWIFPLSSHLFKKWWNEFLRWTFFAPIVIFFLYLSIATAGQMSAANTNTSGVSANLAGLGYTSTTNLPIVSGLSSMFGTVANTLMGTFLQMIVVVGLVVGGLYAANKFSIMGAKAGMGAIEGGANAFGAYVGKSGVRGTLVIASRVAAPKPTRGPGGAPYTPLNTRRAKVASWLYRQSQNPALKTQPGAKGLAASVWTGMKKGSGLFKGKEVHDWECQNCIPSGQSVANIIRSTKKPGGSCNVCGAPAATANWKQV